MRKSDRKPKTDRTHPIALSFDLEYWWCSELLDISSLTRKPEILADASQLILRLLDKHRIKSTFFILGTVAEKFPHLVEAIYRMGHEVASHGHTHSNVFGLSPQQFDEEVKKSTEILSSITNEKPIGFRAPNFSFDQSTPWAYGILEKHGYKYSSSVFPFKTKLYGLPKAPVFPYSPARDNLLLPDPERKIIEFPLSVFNLLGKNIPVSGGFYFRVLPISFTRFALGSILRRRPAVVYLHMRDLYAQLPRFRELSLKARLFHYWGLKTSLLKFEDLLESFNFKSVRDTLGL
jgi:polysaccharide deacetylase family protein (PEP-CTERM system associated)